MSSRIRSAAVHRREGRRELAHRVTGSVAVTLYWTSDGDTTSIEIRQRSTDEAITFDVSRDRALDAFHHPFAHLPV